MGIAGMSKDEETKISKAVWEFQTNGVTEELCPRCNGKLKFIGNMSSFRIFCENQCGIDYGLRGI